MIPIPTNPTEISQKARALYERELKSKLEPEHIGKYVVVDIDSGDYEVG